MTLIAVVNHSHTLTTVITDGTVCTICKQGCPMTDETKPGVFQMRVDTAFGKQLDDLRKAQDDLPSRAEMIRRLVEAAHGALGKKGAKR